MNAKRISLDTNILVYALDMDAGNRHDLALEIMDRAVYHNCIIPLQALNEFYSVVTRKHNMPSGDADAQIRDWMSLFSVVPATTQTLNRAMSASRKHMISFWDAMIWAVTCEAGANLLVTEDFQHDQVLDQVRFCNPYKLDNPLDDIFGGLST